MIELLIPAAVLAAGITLISFSLSLVIAFLVGLCLLSRRRIIRYPARVYVEFWRGTSCIVQLFWFFFVPPLFGIYAGAVETGIFVLACNVGAYGAEVVRGGVQAVQRGQWEACTALNMGFVRTLYRIILPQAIPGMVPPFGNLMVDALKATSLLSLIAVPELNSKAYMLVFSGKSILLVYGTVLVFYFLVAAPITLATFRIDRRLRRAYAGRGKLT